MIEHIHVLHKNPDLSLRHLPNPEARLICVRLNFEVIARLTTVDTLNFANR